MPKRVDRRREVGARVYAKASSISALSECARQFGALAATICVNGKVTNVESRKINGRNQCYIHAKWFFNDETKEKALHLQSVKLGPIPEGIPRVQGTEVPCQMQSVAPTTAPTEREEISLASLHAQRHKERCRELAMQQSWDQIEEEERDRRERQEEAEQCNEQRSSDEQAEGRQTNVHPTSECDGVQANETWWFGGEVLNPINGIPTRHPWSVSLPCGDVIRENGGRADRTPFEYFMAMYPQPHLRHVVNLTNDILRQKERPGLSVGELLKFYGVLLLVTRLGDFGRLQDLWATTSTSKYIPAPALGSTGMSRDRFMEILSCIRFSKQPEHQGSLSTVQYRWMLVQDFVDSFNAHRASNVTPSELLCVDESISRWYGQGGSWISIGLPMYVAIDRKPENGCEIQDTACGRSGIMLHLELVSTAEDEANRQYEGECNHGTAVLRRVVAPFAGTNRIVCADSYFASVEAADAMTDMGLQFVGVVKTATRQYPMLHLSQMQVSQRGQ